MPEGLSANEVGKEIAGHRCHSTGPPETKHDRRISIAEAVLLSVVAVVAAYSGYAAAKWSTEGSLSLAQASATRTKANRAQVNAVQLRTLDAVEFNAAVRRLPVPRQARRCESPCAGCGPDTARRSTHGWPPIRSPTPTRRAARPTCPSTRSPSRPRRRRLDARADALFERGQHASETSDKYVRTTVFLATVLFLVGISGHFRVRQARYGLIVIASLMLAFSLVQLVTLPGIPG